MATSLYYIHDPLCSWCYAFKTSLSALKQALPPDIEFKRLLGGLAPDSTEPMPLALQQSIQQAWHRIEQTVPGVKFNFAFWSNNTPIRSTYPACRSLLAARKQGIEFEDRLLACIQEAYYQRAQNPALDSTLFECASQKVWTESNLNLTTAVMKLTGNCSRKSRWQEVLASVLIHR